MKWEENGYFPGGPLRVVRVAGKDFPPSSVTCNCRLTVHLKPGGIVEYNGPPCDHCLGTGLDVFPLTEFFDAV